MKKVIFLAFSLVLSAVLTIGCEGKGGGSGGNGHSGVILPPDPGSEGRKTLEGIDSNNNGVRDDVEIAVRLPALTRADDTTD
ncbi:MAG: hypothetical protein LBT81_00765 [Helicobacteraceae bacterium]|jgi:hypothetical protein|nr:hypothetical protein [Helicobacteraceae bacterium]